MPPLTKRRRLLLRWGTVSLMACIGLGYVAFVVTSRVDPSAPAEDGSIEGLTSVLSREVTDDMVSFSFEDARVGAGIDFRHFPATRGSRLPEDMGSGLSWGDYDNDGDPDLFLVNFQGAIAEPVSDGTSLGRPALYRNEGNGRFTEVAKMAGVDRPSYGLGAAWGDYDNDGDLDLYITNYGPNILYRNNGDGTFSDVAASAGVGDGRFSAGCVWGDYNNDGHIDLYVTNYVRFTLQGADSEAIARQYGAEIPFTINPSSYPPEANALYRNNGDGTFSDVAHQAGVANPTGRSLGATWFDFDNDGLIDLYVANDVSANGVYHNLGDGRFADIGAQSLAADYRGAMGLAVGDYESDGDLDLFVTHWLAQENAFYENMFSDGFLDDRGERRLFFMDSAEMIGLGQISLKMVGWATGLADFDNDGFLDLWVVNGNTLEVAEDHSRLKPQRMQIFRHKPSAGFFEVAQRASPALEEPFVGRGGAHADYDGDGRLDIAVMVFGSQPRLLHNTSSGNNHWLALRLRQQGGNTNALGARVTVQTRDRVQLAQVGTGGSYLSQHHTDLHFGLGEAPGVDKLTVLWPDGHIEEYKQVKADQRLELTHNAKY